ncbi:MAG: hypothetical protein C0410_14315 [Anaerolinea sp.]|nr:hypothetical protein [Anaerolinea sp.]
MRKANLQTQKNYKPETVDPIVRDRILSSIISSSTDRRRLSLDEFERLDPQSPSHRQAMPANCVPVGATH